MEFKGRERGGFFRRCHEIEQQAQQNSTEAIRGTKERYQKVK